jgi:hypothetical protein
MANEPTQLAHNEAVHPEMEWVALLSEQEVWRAAGSRTMGSRTPLVCNVWSEDAARAWREGRVARGSDRGPFDRRRLTEFTITIKPTKIVKSIVFAAALIFSLASPAPISSATDSMSAIERADRVKRVDVIRGELEPRLTKATHTEIDVVSETIADECFQRGIDPLFVLAIIESESNFDIEAVSPTGARGLMQIIPSTFRQVSDAKRMFDPIENVRAGIRYISKLRTEYRFRDPETYLFAYNQGPGAVIDHYKNGTPMAAEAQSYVPTVMSKYKTLLKRYGFAPKDAKKLFLAKR